VELRREAVNNLPRSKYNIITAETVQAQGGAVLEECSEENCVIILGSRIGADYIVRGIISKFETKLTLSVDIYETDNGNLVASSDPVRAEKVGELIEKATVACANMYKKFVNEQNSSLEPKQSVIYTLSTMVNTTNGGNVSRNPNQTYYTPGTIVSVTATPADGYAFTGWSGSSRSTKATLTAPIDRDLTLTANFQYIRQTYMLTTHVFPPEGGVVTRNPYKEAYIPNEAVTVTAMAKSGYTFTGWTGAVSGRTNHATITMDGDKTVTANFYKQSISVPTYQPPTPIPVSTYQQSGLVRAGTFTDYRDGKMYKTVEIGGKKWMAENLNYKTSKSYSGTYGRLYTWNAAISACPRGWHLSTRQDWNHLGQAVGGKEDKKNIGGLELVAWDNGAATKLKSSIDWIKTRKGAKTPQNIIIGTNDYGFSALPDGEYPLPLGMMWVFSVGSWWTSIESNNDFAYFRAMYANSGILDEGSIHKKKGKLAVRCVCDIPSQMQERQIYTPTPDESMSEPELQLQSYVRQDKTQQSLTRTHWYVVSKYHFPISETSRGFGGEFGRVSKKGWFFGIDIGGGANREPIGSYYLERGNVGVAADIGGVYNLTENLQILYGAALGYWAFEQVESGMYWLWGDDDPEIGYLEQGFVGPSIKLRWRFIELSYRGLIGSGWKRHVLNDGDKYDCYNSQLMLGINSYGLVKLLSEGW
jgi:uncharacterized protein (TIGR02145 family)/uncharacterized repeat protein (TIGR02543 family)